MAKHVGRKSKSSVAADPVSQPDPEEEILAKTSLSIHKGKSGKAGGRKPSGKDEKRIPVTTAPRVSFPLPVKNDKSHWSGDRKNKIKAIGLKRMKSLKSDSFWMGTNQSASTLWKKPGKPGVTSGQMKLAKDLLQAMDRASQLVKLLKKRFTCSWFLVLLSFLSFCAAAAEQQTIWKLENKADDTCDALKQLISLLSALSIFFVLRKHSLYNRQQKLMGKVPLDSSMWTGGNFKFLVFELLFNCLHCPPFFTMEFQVRQCSVVDPCIA
jgi:hypothetical protein